jgi:hypothetical protein
MASAPQIIANIANAQKSTGPRTEEGRKISSRNALTHGLYSKAKVLPGESQEAYDALIHETLTTLAPGSEVERNLATQIADDMWRMERLRLIERVELANAVDLRRLNVIGQMISRVRRDIAGNLASFQSLQRHRQKQQKEQLPDAIKIRRAGLAGESPANLDQFGFDLPLDLVDAQIARQDALRNAGEVGKTIADCSR